jgi:hypothetical protein
MAEERERKPRPGTPGTTSDPNQSNREPARDRGAEQVREAPVDPVPGGARPEDRRDDADRRQKP